MLDKLARRGTINILLVLFLILEIAVFPGFSGRLKTLSGGLGLLDTRFLLKPDQVHQMVGAYGVEGRNIYATGLLTADLLFPLVYTLLLAGLIHYLFRELYPPNSRMHRAAALPFAAMAFDYAENLTILSLLAAYPGRLSLLEALLPLLTLVKWTLVLLSFGVVMWGVIAYLKTTATHPA